MNQKSRKKNQNGPEACHSGEKNEKKGKEEPGLRPKPHWPIGLHLPPDKDISCFIPEDLAVVLSRDAFEHPGNERPGVAHGVGTSIDSCNQHLSSPPSPADLRSGPGRPSQSRSLLDQAGLNPDGHLAHLSPSRSRHRACLAFRTRGPALCLSSWRPILCRLLDRCQLENGHALPPGSLRWRRSGWACGPASPRAPTYAVGPCSSMLLIDWPAGLGYIRW